MIWGALLCGAAIITTVGIAAVFWDDLRDFLTKAAIKARRIADGAIYGCRVFLKKLQEGVQEISRHYYKIGQQWSETEYTRQVPASEVPPELLARASPNMELDITEEMEMQLNV